MNSIRPSSEHQKEKPVKKENINLGTKDKKNEKQKNFIEKIPSEKFEPNSKISKMKTTNKNDSISFLSESNFYNPSEKNLNIEKNLKKALISQKNGF